MDFNMDMENFIGRMEVSIEVITREESDREMANFSMEIVKVFVVEYGEEVFFKAKVTIKSQEVQRIESFGEMARSKL